MKKIILAVMAVAAIGFTSCGNKTQQAEAVDSVAIVDSLAGAAAQGDIDAISALLNGGDATKLGEALAAVKEKIAKLIKENPAYGNIICRVDKSVEIVETGKNVVLDWGFWQKREREYARKFYEEHGIPCELHYLYVPDAEWNKRIEKRNKDITEGRISAYYVDNGLKAKFSVLFEPPEENEADVIIKS